MAKPRNKAVVAGLTLTLTFGCLSVPALATTASGQAEDAAQRNLPAPAISIVRMSSITVRCRRLP